jgi:hypothetical protein
MESQSLDEVYTKQKDFIEILKTGKRKHLHETRSQESKQIRSLKRGGKSVMIKEELEKGITDPKEIGKNLGLTSVQVADARKTLRNWKLDLPRITRDYAEIQKAIEVENDDKKLQGVLDGLSMESVTSFVRNNKNQTTFLYLGNLLGELGYTKNARLVGEKLKADGIPVAKYMRALRGEGKSLITWVVLNKDKQRISDVADEMFKSSELRKRP